MQGAVSRVESKGKWSFGDDFHEFRTNTHEGVFEIVVNVGITKKYGVHWKRFCQWIRDGAKAD